jgi:hypothetical protein
MLGYVCTMCILNHIILAKFVKKTYPMYIISYIYVSVYVWKDLMNYFYHNVLSKNTGALPPRQQYCGWSNISVCDVTADTPAFTVTLYNPLARPVTYWMNIPVQNPFYQVYDANQKTVHALVSYLHFKWWSGKTNGGVSVGGCAVGNLRMGVWVGLTVCMNTFQTILRIMHIHVKLYIKPNYFNMPYELFKNEFITCVLY